MLQRVLEKRPQAIAALLARLAAESTKEGADWLPTLSAALDWLRLLVSPTNHPTRPERTLCLSPHALATAVQWRPTAAEAHAEEQSGNNFLRNRGAYLRA